MRNIRLLFLLGFITSWSMLVAGKQEIDSLRALLPHQTSAELVRSLNKLSTLLLLEDIQASGQYARQARSLALLLGDSEALAASCNRLGAYYLQKGVLDSAAQQYHEAVSCLDEDMDIQVSINALTGLAVVFQNQEKNDSARIYYHQARVLAETNNQPSYLAPIYNGLGIVAKNQAQLDTAIDMYFKAVSYYRDIGNIFNAAIVMNNIATIAMAQDQYEMALAILDSACIIYRQTGFPRGIVAVNNNKAICYRHLNLEDSALACLNRSLQESERSHMMDNKATAYHSLGNLMLDMGNLSEAKKNLDASMHLSDSMGMGFGILVNSIELGRYYSLRKEWDSVILCGHRSLHLAETMKLPPEQSKIYLQLSEAFKARGQYDSALYYKDKHAELVEVLHQQEVMSKIATLESRYQQQKNLTKIAQLNEQNAWLKIRMRTALALAAFVVMVFVFWLLVRKFKSRNRKLSTALMTAEEEKLKKEIENQNKELMVNAIHLVRVSDITYQVAVKLKQLRYQVAPRNLELINELINELEHGATAMAWDEFETRFKKVHEGFYTSLRTSYPDLTPTEIKVCSFIRLNLTTKDIATLTNRSVRTVENTRNRIRHKLGMVADENLTTMLMDL